jgi:hypothetical protein
MPHVRGRDRKAGHNGLVLYVTQSVDIAAVSPCHLASRWDKIVFNTL